MIYEPDRPLTSGELLARMARSLQAWQRALGQAAEGGRVLDVAPFVASVVPAARGRSLPNAAAIAAGTALDAAMLGRLAGAYRAAGTEIWGLWIHESNHAAQLLLGSAGYRLDSQPAAMALELNTVVERPAPEGVSVERTADLERLAAPLSSGYGFAPEFLTRGLPRLLDNCQAWVARVDGALAAGLLLVRHLDDAGVFMVATAPELRRRGAAGYALRTALLHAKDRGCTSSTLQSSELGRSVYTALGYKTLGVYQLWEHRPR
jgi:GNAT superfamily N-acetyltransferase